MPTTEQYDSCERINELTDVADSLNFLQITITGKRASCLLYYP